MAGSEIFAWVLSGIGALAWLPWLFDKLEKPVIRGRLVSHFENMGTYNGRQGMLCFVALNIISLKRPFHIREIRVSVDGNSGHPHWVRFNTWTGPNQEKLKLVIKPEDTLPFVGTIPQDVTKTVYATIFVPEAHASQFEEMKIVLVAHSGNQQTITIRNNDINGDQIIWDDRIWKEEPKKTDLGSKGHCAAEITT